MSQLTLGDLEDVDVDEQDDDDVQEASRVDDLRRRLGRDVDALVRAVDGRVADVDAEDVVRAARFALESLRQFLVWCGSTAAASWPTILLGALSLALWLSLGLEYFGAGRWSVTSALGLFGLTTTLYLCHVAGSRYWPLYQRLTR